MLSHTKSPLIPCEQWAFWGLRDEQETIVLFGYRAGEPACVHGLSTAGCGVIS